MGWSVCGNDSKGRKIGYAVSAKCDHEGCKAKIDRGLGYACGGMHGTDNHDCEGYFCGDHMSYRWDPDDQRGKQFCMSCAERLDEYKVEEYQEALEATLVNFDKQAIYDLLIRWDEVGRIPPDRDYMTEKEFEYATRQHETHAVHRAWIEEKAASTPDA